MRETKQHRVSSNKYLDGCNLSSLLLVPKVSRTKSNMLCFHYISSINRNDDEGMILLNGEVVPFGLETWHEHLEYLKTHINRISAFRKTRFRKSLLYKARQEGLKEDVR